MAVGGQRRGSGRGTGYLVSDGSGVEGWLEGPPPDFSIGEAELVAEELFGIEGRCQLLASERDQNFRLLVKGQPVAVLKFSNAADSQDVLMMQVRAMIHVRTVEPGVPVMQPMRAKDGSYVCKAQRASGLWTAVRMFGHLPGSHRSVDTLAVSTLSGLGMVCARVGRALSSFECAFAVRELPWSPWEVERLTGYVGCLENPQIREIVEAAISEYVAKGIPSLLKARCQVIHNDLSLSNLLFEADDSISGVLDFGDVVFGPLVSDLAVVCEHVLERPDGWNALAAVVSGYASEVGLGIDEVMLIGYALLARWSGLLTLSSWREKEWPATTQYVRGWTRGVEGQLRLARSVGFGRWSQYVGDRLATELEKRGLI